MFKIYNKESKYYLEFNNIKLEGTNTSNHIWAYRKNIDEFHCERINETPLFELIKEFKINNLPNRLQFHIYNTHIDRVEPPIEKLPYPFDSCRFLSLDDKFIIGLSCYFELDKWKRKWAAHFYFEEIEKYLSTSDEIKVIKHPEYKIYDEGYEFYLELEFDSKTGITIENALEKSLPKFNDLINNVEGNLSNLAKLIKILELWNVNKKNSDEEFWQKFFIRHSKIISQAFAYPTVIFKDKAYLGGKGIDNKNGKVIDYVYINKLNNNIALIELKTPVSKLVSSRYRGTFSLSKELTGSVNQLLQYRDEQIKEYYIISSKSKNKYELFNPKCLLIIGKLEDLNSDKRAAFELFRNELKSIEIVTFDELFLKIEILLELMKEKN